MKRSASRRWIGIGALTPGGRRLLAFAAETRCRRRASASSSTSTAWSCHNYTDYAGGFELELFDPASADGRPEDRREDDPQGARRHDAARRQAAAELRDAADVRGHDGSRPSTRTRSSISLSPKLHRMNRTEYANAVRDLLALQLDSTQFLPPDDASRGFDNQAGTLTLSPALLEAYLSAAARISRLAARRAGRADAGDLSAFAEDTTQNYHVEGLPLGTRGGLQLEHTFPSDGNYTVKVFSVNLGNMGNFRPFGEVRGEQLLVYVDGKRVAQVDWDKALGVERRFDDEGARPAPHHRCDAAREGRPAQGRRDVPRDELRAGARSRQGLRAQHDRDGWPAWLHVLSAHRQRACRWSGQTRHARRIRTAVGESSRASRSRRSEEEACARKIASALSRARVSRLRHERSTSTR